MGPLASDGSQLSRRFHSPPAFISRDFIVGNLSLGSLISLETGGKEVLPISQGANSLSQWVERHLPPHSPSVPSQPGSWCRIGSSGYPNGPNTQLLSCQRIGFMP